MTAREPYYKAFGQALIKAREKAGLSQEEVGAMMGWTRAQVCNLERGTSRVLLHHAMMLAEVLKFQLPPAKLVYTTEKKTVTVLRLKVHPPREGQSDG